MQLLLNPKKFGTDKDGGEKNGEKMPQLKRTKYLNISFLI